MKEGEGTEKNKIRIKNAFTLHTFRIIIVIEQNKRKGDVVCMRQFEYGKAVVEKGQKHVIEGLHAVALALLHGDFRPKSSKFKDAGIEVSFHLHPLITNIIEERNSLPLTEEEEEWIAEWESEGIVPHESPNIQEYFRLLDKEVEVRREVRKKTGMNALVQSVKQVEPQLDEEERVKMFFEILEQATGK
jgi:hypothetical protein